MKFNPLTQKLYTDSGELVKEMYCPYNVSWEQMKSVHSAGRKCDRCNHVVHDTKSLSEDEILQMVQQNPKICFKIDLNQNNLKIITDGLIQQR